MMNLYCLSLMLTMLLHNAVSFTFGRDNHHLPGISDTSVIATVGSLNITVKEFLDSYEFGPSFVKKSANPKMTHLQYMINEKLIALDGYANGIINDRSVLRMLKEVEDDIIVTEWYRHYIAPLAVVDSSLIKRGIQQSSVKLTFRYIFSSNEFDLQDVKTLLDNDHSFDSLYSLLKQDSKFFVDEVTTNFFSLFEDNPKVAEKLAILKLGACPGIIKSKDGFYLIHFDNSKKDLITTPIKYQTMWTKIEKHFSKKILDSLTTFYIRGVMEDCPPTISGKALKGLFNFLSKTNIQTQFSDKSDTITDIHFNSEIISDKQFGNQILVGSKCDNFTINDFLEWYHYRNFKIDFANPTASTLNYVKEVLFKMVRDKRLIKTACNAGYASDANVQFEIRQWRDKLAYWKQKSKSIESPAVTEEEIQKIYSENRIKYAKDSAITYEQKNEEVKNDLMLHKYNAQLHYYLNTLSNRYPIKINQKLLNSIHVSDENLSKKIDLFILKKGGTLQRQAFPTIDNEWRYY